LNIFIIFLEQISLTWLEVVSMPKKEHIHVVTDSRHKELLKNLGRKFGSMTKAFEFALETFEKTETVGSCETCQIKFEAEQAKKIQNLMNTVTFTANNIHELIKYLQGDYSATELILRARDKAYEFVKQYKGIFYIEQENSYENLLATIEEYKKRTRLFKTIEVDSFSKKIVACINIFEKLPVFVMAGLMGFLEGFNFTFKIELYNFNILLTWLTPELYFQEKAKNEERLYQYSQNAERLMQPYLMKKGMIYLTPEILDWGAENLLDHHLIPITIIYKLANLLIPNQEVMNDTKQTCETIIQIISRINIAEEITCKHDDTTQTFRLQCLLKTPNIAKFVLQSLILMLGKFGWKLIKHRIDSTQLDVKFRFVGEGDSIILNPLYQINFTGFLNQRFQKLSVVSFDELYDLCKNLYHADLQAFDNVYRKQGRKLAEAIRILAKNDLRKMREIAIKVLPIALKQTNQDPKSIDLLPEFRKFTLIFKETNLIQMEKFRSLISGVAEGFGYQDIKSKIYENMVIIEFIRPDEELGTTEPIKAKANSVSTKSSKILSPYD